MSHLIFEKDQTAGIITVNEEDRRWNWKILKSKMFTSKKVAYHTKKLISFSKQRLIPFDYYWGCTFLSQQTQK